MVRLINSKGVKEASGNLAVAQEASVYARDQAMQDLAEKIGNISQDKVPVLEGLLKGSYTYFKLGKYWRAGYNKKYATIQHENPDFNHPNGGSAFYLTAPVKEHEQELKTFFKDRYWYHFRVYCQNKFKL